MAIKYTSIDQLKFNHNSYIRKTDINDKFKKLIENDILLDPSSNIKPQIWECKWFNNNNISGYNKGDAVWINTESEINFIKKHISDIYNYALNNQYLKQKIKTYTTDDESYELYKKIAFGYKDGSGISIQPLYYIGNIKNPVQIKICTKNNVKTTPDNTEDWKDFYRKPENNIQLLNELKYKVLTEQFNNHLINYHIDTSYGEIVQKYLINDMSNINNDVLQRYNYNHNQTLNIKGFDYIKLSIKKKFSNGTYKWFKLWNSGYLEHGGTINIENKTEYETYVYDNSTVKVDLRWNFDNNQTAPVYDFPTLVTTPFYQEDLTFICNYESYDNNDNINHEKSYCIAITPLQINENNPFHNMNTGICEINTIKNGSFCFIPTNNQHIYSYYCSGFTVSQVKNLKYKLYNNTNVKPEPKYNYVTIKFISNFNEIFNKTLIKGQSLGDTIEYLEFHNISANIQNFYGWSTSDIEFNEFNISDPIFNDMIVVSFIGNDDYYYCSSPNMVNATRFDIIGKTFNINSAYAIDNTYLSYDGQSQHEINTQNENIFTVIFIDYDYSIIKRSYINKGQSAVPPPNPVRNGYTFSGWSKSYTNVTSDLTIQAIYN